MSGSETGVSRRKAQTGGRFDPELLYVECSVCGRPVMWGQGETTRLLSASHIDVSKLDEHCLLVSDGCPTCAPERVAFKARIVRLS
ncbi:MAG: hypothetical protein EOM25_10580 [Deltaproteobacteria bacterium]|nr:hypothetical protein [Deltaproteobacteria bacterium]